MFYLLYEIRNNINDKIYVGVHKTKDMNDGYMGSGKLIQAAIKKYGIENFTKVILETFESAEAMYARENEVVTDEFLLREDTYNLRRGGTGGFDYINKIGAGDRTGETRTPEQRATMGHDITDAERQASSKRVRGEHNPMKQAETAAKVATALRNKKKTDEHIEKIRLAVTGQIRAGYKLKPGRIYSVARIFEEVECPHCRKVGKLNAMKRWHFDKCKISK
jgi:hypothetical protein